MTIEHRLEALSEVLDRAPQQADLGARLTERVGGEARIDAGVLS